VFLNVFLPKKKLLRKIDYLKRKNEKMPTLPIAGINKKIILALSKIIILGQGDVIATGTPPGISPIQGETW
jgi:hypothetical protein